MPFTTWVLPARYCKANLFHQHYNLESKTSRWHIVNPFSFMDTGMACSSAASQPFREIRA